MTGMLAHTFIRVLNTNLRSLRCIQVIAGVLGRAGEAGQKQRLAAAAKGTITYRPAKNLVMPGAEDEDVSTSTLKQAAPFEDIANTDELATKLDEVNNRESHRLKGGRELKATA
jgi:small subunit ribosomal protein S2